MGSVDNFEDLSLEEKAPRGINLHPDNYTPSTLKSTEWDVVVIGSGTVGRIFALRTASAGLKTIMVENELWGGDCPFWACIPSKALLRPGEALESARMLTGAKELISNKSVVDVEKVFLRRDTIVQGYKDQFLVDLNLSQGFHVLRGMARLNGEKKVSVVNVNGEEAELTAKHAVVLATGSKPSKPKITGLDKVKYWTPRDATSANEVPKHLIIVGGGVVGCELATAYSEFGSKVTIICPAARLMGKFEPEASKRVQASLEARGAEIRLSCRADAVEQMSADEIKVSLGSGESITGSKVLIATGRVPRLADCGLESIKVTPQDFAVDEKMCVTNVPGQWLYAIGDATKRSFTTHMGVYEGRAAAYTIIDRSQGKKTEAKPWNKYSATADHASIAQVVVTDPNVASVGLTLADAKAAGKNVVEVTVPFMFPGAWVSNEFNYDGWAQWVLDIDSRTIVGATIVGRECSSLLHPSTVAMVGGVTIDRLWHAVAPFPTMSEIYTSLLTEAEKVLGGGD